MNLDIDFEWEENRAFVSLEVTKKSGSYQTLSFRSKGKTISLDVNNYDGLDNDEGHNWCLGSDPFGDGDYGKVMGKQGKNISAIRSLIFAINAKEGGKRARLDVIDR